MSENLFEEYGCENNLLALTLGISPSFEAQTSFWELSSLQIESREQTGQIVFGEIVSKDCFQKLRQLQEKILIQYANFYTMAHLIDQDILIETVELFDRLRRLGWEVDLHWIPAHAGIAGNEEADRAAKGAITSAQDPEADLVALHDSTIPKSTVATCKYQIRQKLNKEWEEAWHRHKHGRDLYKLGVRPGKGILTLHNRLHRAISSVITQMRTGKIGLKSYLRSIDKAETDQCECLCGKQTVQHIILECRNWAEERNQMWADRQPCIEISKILNNPTLAVRAAKMLIRTGLLGQFRAVPSTVLVY